MSGIDFVNTKIGTLNEPRFSNGNVYPVVARPFGMTNFTVQTDGKAGNWFFNPLSHAFEGIRLTHQPSPWVGDYGHMLFLPFTGKLGEEGKRWSSFRPEETRVRPDSFDVYLQRYRLRVRLAPTVRGCVIWVKRETKDGGMVETNGEKTGFAILPYASSAFASDGKKAEGWTDAQSIWGFKTLREYFYVEFSETPAETEKTENGGLAFRFGCENFCVRIATSFVSVEQAKRNFEREVNGKDFEKVRAEAAEDWSHYLDKIEISDENEARKRAFYSCLYRACLYPRVFYEYDADGVPVHFNADTGGTEKGVFYTDNGFWDTYRTVYPFLSLLAPDRVSEIAEGIVNYAEETGWLPKWLSPGEIGIMPGTLAEAVLADACTKGLVGNELLDRAYRVMRKNAFQKGEGRHGRRGIEEYIRLGYVPDVFRESVNHTLDCAYGDFCIARTAELAGDDETAAALYARSKNYVALFDKESGFFRGRNEQGAFREEFDPYAWGGDNCEGGSWQNSFSVCHDIEGLAALHGGKENLEKKLDGLFAAEPIFRVGGYGEEIHEMSEMASVDFGQCAISNQPSFHIPWLYAAIGKRKKTEYWVRKLAAEAFSDETDGFPGDEDNGTTACWYIFACLGFYPLCPGKAEYVTATPLFEKITVGGRALKRFSSSVVSHAEVAALFDPSFPTVSARNAGKEKL